MLQRIRPLVGSRKSTLVKDACWTLSNITAGTAFQIQAVMDAKLIPLLITLMKSPEFEIKKEAAWAIANAINGALLEQIHEIAEMGCIQPFCDLLGHSDLKMITLALDGLESILKAGEGWGGNKYSLLIEEAGGIDHLENLSIHKDEEICSKASDIIDRFFGGEEKEEPVMESLMRRMQD